MSFLRMLALFVILAICFLADSLIMVVICCLKVNHFHCGLWSCDVIGARFCCSSIPTFVILFNKFLSESSARGIVHLPLPMKGRFGGLSWVRTILWLDSTIVSVISQCDRMYIRCLCT